MSMYAQDADAIVEECEKQSASMSSTLQHFRYRGGHALTQERFDVILAWLLKQGRIR